MTRSTSITRPAIRTPRAAAVAGIAFSLLLIIALLLVRRAVPSDPDDAGEWLSDGSKRDSVVLALNLLPFAGIAFLWFIGVVRDRIGEGEDRFFATVFLGSGLLFIAMLFATGAIAGGVFAISTTTIATRLGLAPRWLTVLGLATGVVLLLSAGIVPWIEVIFPGLGVRVQRAHPGCFVPGRAAHDWQRAWPLTGFAALDSPAAGEACSPADVLSLC